jgi:glycosyltransferase involved in cell wall biosynthesis
MRISVLAPLYAGGRYIDELYSRFVDRVLSVAGEYEVILVNDTSRDDSLTRAEGYLARSVFSLYPGCSSYVGALI